MILIQLAKTPHLFDRKRKYRQMMVDNKKAPTGFNL